MKFFKNPKGQVFAYEADGSQDGVIPKDQTPITTNEAEALRFPPIAIETIKTNALTRIDQFHSAVIDKLVGSPTQTEKDTWAMKLDTANAIALGQPVAAAGAAFLHAAGLNDTTAQNNWARTVLVKSTGYAQVVGVAERLRDAAKTAVKAASDEAGVQAALDAQHAAADAAVASISKS